MVQISLSFGFTLYFKSTITLCSQKSVSYRLERCVQGGTVASRLFLEGGKRQRGQCCLVPELAAEVVIVPNWCLYTRSEAGRRQDAQGCDMFVIYVRCKSSKEHLSALDFLHLRGECVVHSDVLANIQTLVSKDVTESSRSIWSRHHMEWKVAEFPIKMHWGVNATWQLKKESRQSGCAAFWNILKG